ncbi:MAG: hypothetical protein JWN58_2155, partial [Gammaproteobacteria bacterium]|nr:hypothetical protein [Gammaproteobacteria bacterium]
MKFRGGGMDGGLGSAAVVNNAARGVDEQAKALVVQARGERGFKIAALRSDAWDQEGQV